nr:hypothetical protein [Tanacetum cinerariifolium]
MSDASSAVTYTSVYSDSEPYRYYREESSETGSPRVIVYGYDGLPMQPVAPPSPDYDEEPFEDEEDDEEEGEHIALTDSSVVPIMDLIPLTSNTKAFETNESAPTPGSPQTIIPFSYTRLRSARKTVRLEPPMSASIEACIARYAALLSPPLPVPSLPLHFPSLLTTSLTDTGAPLGFSAAKIRMRDLLPSTFHRTDIPEADVPPRKRDFLTTPALGFEVRESFISSTTRQPKPTLESDLRRYRVEQTGYGITNKQRTKEFETQLATTLGRIEILEARMYPEESAKVERYIEQDIDLEIYAEIDKCFSYTYALRDRGIDARVVVEVVDRDEIKTGVRGPIEVIVERIMHPSVPEDIPEPTQEGAVEGHRIIRVESSVTALTERVAELERITGCLEAPKMPNTRFGASMTYEEVKELVAHRVAEEMEAREAARNLETLNENGDKQEGENGGNGNGGNGNGENGGNRGNGN